MSAQEILQQIFGYQDFRGDQSEIIASALKGEHSLVLMPTGMGKSLCYQIPSRLFKGLTLVISPLIALMKDQVDAAKSKGFRCCYINSSLSRGERIKRYEELAAKAFELVYVTPERFQKENFREALAQNKVDLLAIDEAHCISQWGHDFRPDYTRIHEFRKLLGNPTTMALTATATPEVQSDIIQQMGLSALQVRIFSHGIERPNLQLDVESIYGLDNKIQHFLDLRKKEPGPIIVYFSLIDSLKKFSEKLYKAKIPYGSYHGQLGDRERKQQQERFMKSPDALMLATPAFGLGVNKQDIRMVVHAEVPGSLEAYYQEVGRAGRDGKPARGVLLYDEDDITIQMDFIKWSNPDPQFIQTVYHLIEANRDRVRFEGYDYLRSQMNFYNKRDFRVETSINLLERWGCLEGTIEQRTIQTIQPPPSALLDPEQMAQRLKRQQEKLLEMVQFAKDPEDRKGRLYRYFGV